MRKIFLAVCLILRLSAAAQEVTPDSAELSRTFYGESKTLATDSAHAEVRSFDAAKVDQFRNDDQFNYRLPPTVAESLWDRFLSAIGWFFDLLWRGATQTNWGQLILYLAGLVLLVGIIMTVLKVDAFRVFTSGADQGPSSRILLEDIQVMDFDQLMLDALARKEYRLAVRLTFLRALKMLSDKQEVDWRPGKTNHDYVEEVKSEKLKAGFNELSFYFDYAWYGHFPVNETVYERVNTIFLNWKQQVQ